MSRFEESYACRAFGRHRDFTLPGARAQYPPDLEIEPRHLDIDLAVDLTTRTVSGTVTTAVMARHQGVRTLKLDAVDFADLDVRDPDGRAVDIRYDGRVISVTWREAFVAGEERRLAVSYRVKEPVAGIFFSQPSPAYPDDSWYAVTDHETERARHWLPCIDLPSVRTSLDFHLRTEERFIVLANGALLGETLHGDGTKTAHWRLEQLCPSYLVCFAIGEFTRADDGDFEGRPIAYFGSPSHSAEDLKRTFGRTRDMLAWMTRKLGSPFPYPKYFQFAASHLGGAMENISLVSWSEHAVMDPTLAREQSWNIDTVNLHEMAHSYFGDWIVCRDFAHAWLKESWAVYMEVCWLEDTASRDEMLYNLYVDAQAYFDEADDHYMRPIVTRVFNYSWDMYDRHLYQGGSCRLHTLRQLLGDDVFWAAVRDYVASYGGKVVETDDFRRLMEQHSGRSLGRFFNQWFLSKGYPSLKVSFDYDQEKKEGTVEIEQTQVDEKEEIPAFQFDLELGWIIDGELHLRTVEIRDPKHIVLLDMPADPEQVRVDPQAKVLHKLSFNPGAAKLKKQLTGAPDAIGRIQAGHELARTGKTDNIDFLAQAYIKEPFWGVRREWARALGKAGVGSAVKALIAALQWERDPMVLESLVRAAGGYRDPELEAAIEARLDEGLAYRASQAALEALGKQRAAAPFERLAGAASTTGYNGIVQAGAFRGLAHSRKVEALDILLRHTLYGATPHLARPAAVSALADLGTMLDRARREAVVERLVDLLRDPVDPVRAEAVRGLGSLADSRAIPALMACRESLSAQDQNDIDAAIRDIRQGDKPRPEAIEKGMDRIDDRLQKLEDLLRKFEARLDK